MSEPQTRAATTPREARKIDVGLNEDGIVLCGVIVLLLGAVLWSSLGNLTEKTDFSITYVGTKIICCGNPSKLYDLREQAALRDALYKHADPLVFEHPPFEALLLAPLGRLPFRTAYRVWGVINAGVWLLLMFMVRPHSPWPQDTLGYAGLWFLFMPLGAALFHGQASLILLLVYAITFITLKRQQDFRAGAVLGLGLFKFQFILPFALIFFFRRKWRFLAGFVSTAVLLGVLSLAAIGWEGVLSYIHLLLEVAAHPSNSSYGAAMGMATLQGFAYAVLGHWLGSRTISFIVAGFSVLMILIMAWCWQKSDRENIQESFDLLFAASIGVSLMAGFHMFTSDLSPLMLALLLVASHFPPSGRRVMRSILATLLVLFWSPPVFIAFLTWKNMYLMFPLLTAFTFATAWLAKASAGAAQLEAGSGPLTNDSSKATSRKAGLDDQR